MSRILVVGFDCYGDNMYPHLKKFIDELGVKKETKYMQFRERGFFNVFKKDDSLKELIQKVYGICCFFKNISIDTLKIIREIKEKDTVIAVDSLTYLIIRIIGLIFKNKEIVLWSHDIVVVSDNNSVLLKLINKITGLFLKNNKLIIQDEKRLKLFCINHSINESEIKTFFLPVCLPDINDVNISKRISANKIKLLQIGYIHSSRQSNLFLEEYQNIYNKYILKFHGYISEEIFMEIEDIKVKPVISEQRVAVEQIYKIILDSDIGIIGYCTKSNNENFHLISRASCQLVEFLRIGKPILTIENKTDLAEFINKEKIGIVLKNVEELREKEIIIRNNYEEYAINARKCYEKYFCMENYLDVLLRWLKCEDKLC